MNYAERITSDVRENMALAREVLIAYTNKAITVDEKNGILAQIIESDMIRTQRILNVGFTQNRCKNCAGRGFTIIPELVQDVYYIECKGDPEKGILPCNGTHILTKVCERCHGLTIREVIEQNRDKLEVIPPEGFIKQHEQETFRILRADEAKDKDTSEDDEGEGKVYYYIPKKPCKACGGTGRFMYQNEKRTTPCTCVKKRLKPTGKIKTCVICPDCHGDGRRIDNPVISVSDLEKLRGIVN